MKITPEKMLPTVVGCLSSNQSCCPEITKPNISSITDGQNAPKKDFCRDEIIAPVISQELTKQPDIFSARDSRFQTPVIKINYATALKKDIKKTPPRGMCNHFTSFLKGSYL